MSARPIHPKPTRAMRDSNQQSNSLQKATLCCEMTVRKAHEELQLTVRRSIILSVATDEKWIAADFDILCTLRKESILKMHVFWYKLKSLMSRWVSSPSSKGDDGDVCAVLVLTYSERCAFFTIPQRCLKVPTKERLKNAQAQEYSSHVSTFFFSIWFASFIYCKALTPVIYLIARYIN